MADLADKIDDFICISNGYVDLTYDTLAMYLFGAFVLLILVLAMTLHLYGKYKKSPKAVPVNSSEKVQNLNNLETKAAKDKEQKYVSTTAGNKSVPSTPPSRKRLGSKSGKMNLISAKKSTNVFIPPTATGPEPESVKWVNDLVLWLYSDSDAVNELSNLWLQSLNEFMKDSVTEHGVGVELIRLIPESHQPNLTNIFCECASNDDITITCDCEATAAMQLKAFRQRGEKVEVSHYRVNISKFRGRLNIFCITEKLQVEVKFDGWPEIKILLAQVGTLKNNNLDEQSLQDVIVDIITSALRGTEMKFNLGRYSSCPRFRRPVANPQPNHLPLHYDSLLSSSNSNTYKVGDKLLVKVVKATGLAIAAKQHNDDDINNDRISPYCILEVDNPPQSHQTVTLQNSTDSPTWNEHFLFNINARSRELMFEVYDKTTTESNGRDKFLGLAIVSVNELMEHSFQRQVLSLQSRPYQNDGVSGNLVLEFTFIETTTNNNNNNNRSIDKLSAKADNKQEISYTNRTPPTPPKPIYHSNRDYLVNGVNDIDAKDRNQLFSRSSTTTTSAMTNKSTLIIHSVQKITPQNSPINTTKQDEQPSVKEDNEVVQQDEPLQATTEDNEVDQDNLAKETPAVQHNEYQNHEQQNQQDMLDSSHQSDGESHRSRSKRKRDFFGTIRKRLNRSKGRSKSVDKDVYNNVTTDKDENPVHHSPPSRSTSADRARDHSSHSGHSTIGPLPLESSARSSLSEVSGVSGASSRTYFNESSTLILETNENGIKKFYLVPLSLVQKNRWKKKGIKLHIYNDHTFVARHLPLGTVCQVCNHNLPKRLGKQGYECRDCQLKCHKVCHVRTESTCPTPTVNDMELSGTIKDPKIGANNRNGKINGK